MKLLTQEIIKKMPSFEAADANENPAIVCKFFTPDANWTWYVISGEVQADGDWLFFGLVDGLEKELGYFSLSQLQKVRGKFGLPVERDRWFEGRLSDYLTNA